MGPRLKRAMDLDQLLKSLRAEKEKLNRVIAALEELTATGNGASATPAGKRRGRRFVGREERLIVSARMKKYWENRRHAKGG